MLPTLILHGWSDSSASFRPLARFLESEGLSVRNLYLADYLSLYDEITPFDLGQAMLRALSDQGVPTARHSFNVVVHSTGGLVVREFLRQFCRTPDGRPDATLTPIRNLLMLAPANFGSPVARLGKSMAGRLFKGWKWDGLFETGENLLHVLEMGSPYSFGLAEADLFDPSFPLFDPTNVAVTVLTGTNAFASPLARLAHLNGSDGTVCVATASLNARRVEVDYADPSQPTLRETPRTSPALALGVFDRDHTTICRPAHRTQAEDWRRLVLAALSVDPAGYPAHVAACADHTRLTLEAGAERPDADERKRFHEYQHVVFRVRDQHGHPIDDYFIEFYQELGDPRDRVAERVHGEILERVKPHSQAANHRSFYFDLTDLARLVAERPDLRLQFSIVAAHPSERVRYRNPPEAPGVGVTVFDARAAASGGSRGLIESHSTLLVDLRLHRDPEPSVFKLKRQS
jgi:pimeloyl-ACP methyl ester carboxylesterase